MTANAFAALCGEFLIEPGMALESSAIVEALKANDDGRVREILKNEF